MEVRPTGLAAEAALPRSLTVFALTNCYVNHVVVETTELSAVNDCLNVSGASLPLTFKSWSDLHFSTGL